MKRKTHIVVLCMIMILSLVGCSSPKQASDRNSIDILDSTYDDILDDAKGSTVNYYGYGGNEVMNKWFDSYVIPQMKKKYDVTVKRVGMNIDDIINN